MNSFSWQKNAKTWYNAGDKGWGPSRIELDYVSQGTPSWIYSKFPNVFNRTQMDEKQVPLMIPLSSKVRNLFFETTTCQLLSQRERVRIRAKNRSIVADASGNQAVQPHCPLSLPNFGFGLMRKDERDLLSMGPNAPLMAHSQTQKKVEWMNRRIEMMMEGWTDAVKVRWSVLSVDKVKNRWSPSRQERRFAEQF